MSNDTTLKLPGDTTGNLSIESELETGDVSSSTCATLSDLGDTSMLSGKQKQAALKWSKMEKKKAKEKERNRQKNKITKNDFYTKSLEYKAWLQDTKGLNFEDMDPKKQKEYFKKFVRKWNGKKLDRKYYRGVDSLWALGTPTTQVSWAMPGLQDLTPGSINEDHLAEKYSRLRGSSRELGTFGKKAGAVMLRQLRAMENISESAPEKMTNIDIQNPTQTSLTQEWPAPPSPLTHVNSTLIQSSDILAALSPLPPQPECTEIAHSTFLPPTYKNKPSSSSSASGMVVMDTCLSPLSVPIPAPTSPDELFIHRTDTDNSPSEFCFSNKAEPLHPSVQMGPTSIKGELDHPPTDEEVTNAQEHTARSMSANVAVIHCRLHAAKSLSHETLTVGGSKTAPPPPPPDRSISLDHLPQQWREVPVTRQWPTAPDPLPPKLARISKVRRNTCTLTPSCHGDDTGEGAVEKFEVKNKDQPRDCGDLKRRHPDDDPYISQLSSASHAVFQTLTTAKGSKKPGEVTPVHTCPSSKKQQKHS